MKEITVAVNNVYKSYQSGSERLRVLRNVSLSAREGESIVISGASGCGKSTLLNLIGGLDRADSGEIQSCGFQVDRLGEKELTAYRSQGVGFIFQFHYLLKDFTALENVMLPMVMIGTPRHRVAKIAEELLKQVGLGNRAAHFPAQLSGGERQRVALARALINNPKLILADEPIGNLDEEHKAVVTDLLFDLIAAASKTLILVTHAADLADRANRKLRLSEGQLVPS